MKRSHNYGQVTAHFLVCRVVMKVNPECQEETQNNFSIHLNDSRTLR